MLSTPTQLGVDNENAIYKGGLVNATSFIGSATAEAISAGNSDGGWNSDYPLSVRSEQPWQIRGGRSDQINPGLFAFIRRNGTEYHDISHRTILSGY